MHVLQGDEMLNKSSTIQLKDVVGFHILINMFVFGYITLNQVIPNTLKILTHLRVQFFSILRMIYTALL